MTDATPPQVIAPEAAQDPGPSDAEVIAEFGPEWILFWSESVKVSQFEIWLPYLRRSRHRFAIAASDDLFPNSVRAKVAELPNVVILQEFATARPWLRRTGTLRGFLYISTKPDNFQVVNSFRGSMHIWLGHGESGKAANAFRTASIYDSVFMASYDGIGRFPKAIQRWVGQGACAIGVPIVEGAVSDPWRAPRPVRTILYAPTWEGYRDTVDYSSIPEFVPILTAALPGLLARGVQVIVRPHPGTGGRAPGHRALIDGLFAAGATRGRTKTEDFAAADILIGDVSGVVGEFLFTQKPIILPTSGRLSGVIKDDKLASEYPWAYPWPVEGLDVAARLDDLATRDPLAKTRARAADRMFRGHRSLEAATATFDLALDCARFRRRRLTPRFMFELRRRVPFVDRRLRRS